MKTPQEIGAEIAHWWEWEADAETFERHHAARIAEAVESAVKARDMEWWQALALVDSVAPTPEAVKLWKMQEAEYHTKQAVAAERLAIRSLVMNQCQQLSDNGDTEAHRYASEIIAAIDARPAL